MKVMKPRNFVIFALAALSGAILLHTSQSVQQAEDRLEILRSSVDREREQTRILKAEWESLNRPERLERLAKEFLDLVPPETDTFVDEASSLPEVPDELLNEESPQTVLQPVSMQPPEGDGQ